MNYHAMMEQALRGVIREALGRVATDGLPGDHHFYITFDTAHPGVQISPQLAARFPQEMTIVLQHQYWGLEVRDDLFAVTLSFSDVQERLVVPFDAVSAFADPSVQFGLQFGTAEEDEGEGEDEAGIENVEAAGREAAPGSGVTEAGPDGADAGEEAEKGGDNVVPLDAFRKK
jgi:hypothetical protein